MKLNKREKILVSLLAVILIIGVYYKFVFTVQREKLATLTKQKAEYDKKLSDINRQISLKKQIETDIKVLNSKISDQTIRLFPAIKEEQLIVYMDGLLAKSNIICNAIAFSDIQVKGVDGNRSQGSGGKKVPLQDLVDEYKGTPKSNQNANKNDNKQSEPAESSTIGISFKGTYASVIEFIKSIEGYDKKIVIPNIQLSQDATGVTGATTLEFYAVPKISDEDKDFFKWEFNNVYGKVNPFDGAVAGTGISSTIEEMGNSVKEPIYDFVMSVRSASSDLPSVMLGRAKDSTKSTYVYADNPQVENVELYLTEKDNKYYCKYKTSRDKYPAQYDGDGVELNIKESNINFKIYSNKRSGPTDLSGANIKIYNKTDKTVKVSIERDDDVRPRAIVSGEGGSVEITRN